MARGGPERADLWDVRVGGETFVAAGSYMHVATQVDRRRDTTGMVDTSITRGPERVKLRRQFSPDQSTVLQRGELLRVASVTPRKLPGRT